MRCPRATITARVWPDGPVRGRCYHVARRRTGSCADCGACGLVPGQRGDDRLCTSCAGIADIVCETCAAVNTVMHNLRICHRCRVRQQVTAKVCDGVEPGGIAAGLIDALCDRNPFGLTRWLTRNPDVVAELHDAATGQRELSHERLDTFNPSQVEHLRRQLVEAGVLPERDHHLGRFDRWSATFLAAIDDPAHRHLIATYTTWHVRRHLTTALETGTLRGSSTRCARRHIRVALVFLQWLDDHQRGLADCHQADLDHWFATGNTNRRSATRVHHLGPPDASAAAVSTSRSTDPPPPTPCPTANASNSSLDSSTTTRSRSTIASLGSSSPSTPNRSPASAGSPPPPSPSTTAARHAFASATAASNSPSPSPDARQPTSPTRPADPAPGCSPAAPPANRAALTHAPNASTPTASPAPPERIAAHHDLVQQIPSPVLAGLIAYNPHVIANRAAALAAPWQHYAALRTRTARVEPSTVNA